jgi:hypothetical protein
VARRVDWLDTGIEPAAIKVSARFDVVSFSPNSSIDTSAIVR